MNDIKTRAYRSSNRVCQKIDNVLDLRASPISISREIRLKAREKQILIKG